MWRNRLVVWLDSSQITSVQFAGFRKQVAHKQYTKLNASPDLGWSQTLDALQDVLLNTKQLKQGELQVILASDFVRYLALPAHEGVIRQSQKVDFARAAYREVYGNLADEWLIRCDDAAPDLNTISAAVDTKLIDALNNVADESKMKLTSVQPYLMPVFNRLKSQLNTGSLYFAIIEPNRILFANLQSGRWQQVRSFLLEKDWQNQIKKITQRANLAVDSQQQHVLLIYSPNDKKSSLPTIQGWALRRIDIKNSWIQNKAESQQFGMLEIA